MSKAKLKISVENGKYVLEVEGTERIIKSERDEFLHSLFIGKFKQISSDLENEHLNDQLKIEKQNYKIK